MKAVPTHPGQNSSFDAGLPPEQRGGAIEDDAVRIIPRADRAVRFDVAAVS